MSLVIATVTPFVGYLTADSMFYTGDEAVKSDMQAAVEGRVVAPADLAPVKTVGHAPRVIAVPGRSLALTWAGASVPGAWLTATTFEYRLSFDLLHDGVASLHESLPSELRPLPLFLVAIGYSDKAQRVAGLSFLVGGESGPRLQILPSGTHTVQPLPELPAAVEAKWQDAAHGLHTQEFHRRVAEAAAAHWPGRIGGALVSARVDRRGVQVTTLAHLGGDVGQVERAA